MLDGWSYVADAAIDLRRGSKNEEMWTKNILCVLRNDVDLPRTKKRYNVYIYEMFR